jgi:transposase
MRRNELLQLSKKQLIKIILSLHARIIALEKDSSNSGKPPSSDMSPPKRPRSLRERFGRKPGGQKGHQGKTRAQVEKPDKIVVCRPSVCGHCGDSLAGIAGLLWEKRQIADIPPIELSVTEYQQESVMCSGCKHYSKGAFPEHVTASFQFGTAVRSMITYLNIVHHIPYDRLTLLMQDLLNIRVAEGTIENVLERAYQQGTSLYEDILPLIKAGSWVGSDETGTKVDAQKWWQWIWQNKKGSYYAVDKSRGYQVVEKHFREDYKGTLVSDCWSAQNNTIAHTGHQLCHAHLLRDLIFCIDAEKSRWAYEMKVFLCSSQKARDHIWKDGFHPAVRVSVLMQYQQRLTELNRHPIQGTESTKLQKRFSKHQEKILHFMTQPDIPFHNNASEQAIRQAKVKKKVSGCFRSERGAKRHATLLSIIETCKKRNMDVFSSLRLLFQGTLAWG